MAFKGIKGRHGECSSVYYSAMSVDPDLVGPLVPAVASLS